MHDSTADISGECDLVSALCVTQDRQAFMPWLLWNHRKQDHPHRELVVVDSSRESWLGSESDDVVVIRCPPGTGVARKRNLALSAARGSVITWFDDDDWQHPRKLSILVSALSAAPLAGSRTSWFVDLHRNRARVHQGQRYVIFNSLGARRSTVSEVRFDERLIRASDTAWFTAVRRGCAGSTVALSQVLSFWLCHRHNLSNPASRYVFNLPVSEVAAAIGSADWGDTDEQLAALRLRLGAPGFRLTPLQGN